MKTLRVVLWSIADDLEVRQSASQNNSSLITLSWCRGGGGGVL